MATASGPSVFAESIRIAHEADADATRLSLAAAHAKPAVASVTTFGLSDRSTWLEEDSPREDGEARPPLPFDDALAPKPLYSALPGTLARSPEREPLWTPPRAEGTRAGAADPVPGSGDGVGSALGGYPAAATPGDAASAVTNRPRLSDGDPAPCRTAPIGEGRG